MRFGSIELSGTFIFQIVNTIAIVAILIGIPCYIISKLGNIENQLKTIKEKLFDQNCE